MRALLLSLRDYAQLLWKSWIAKLLFYLELIGLVAAFVYPALRLPFTAYLALALIGFILANFQVYQETVAKLPQRERKRADLVIGLVEGNSYSYKLDTYPTEEISEKIALAQEAIANANDENTVSRYQEIIDQQRERIVDVERRNIMADADLITKMQVINTGNVGLDLISISAKYNGTPPQLYFSFEKIYDLEQKLIKFPVRIEPNQLFLFHISKRITPLVSNEAELATILGDISLVRPGMLKSEVRIDVVDDERERHSFSYSYTVALRPLKDEYIAQWRDMNEADLLRLAGADEYAVARHTRDKPDIDQPSSGAA